MVKANCSLLQIAGSFTCAVTDRAGIGVGKGQRGWGCAPISRKARGDSAPSHHPRRFSRDVTEASRVRNTPPPTCPPPFERKKTYTPTPNVPHTDRKSTRL